MELLSKQTKAAVEISVIAEGILSLHNAMYEWSLV